jgi:hypothetical protein
MERDEDGNPWFDPGVEIAAAVPGAHEVVVTGARCRRMPVGALTRRGYPCAMIQADVDTTEGPFSFYMTRDEASAFVQGITELLCDG